MISPESGDSPGLANSCGSQTVGYILRVIGSQAGLERNFERHWSNRFQGRRRLQLKRLDGHGAGETWEGQLVSDGTVKPQGTVRRSLSWSRSLPRPGWLWLSIFGVSLGLFLVRFLVPVPVAQADNQDGPRMMCGALGLKQVVPHGYPRYFRYAYFSYAPDPSHCGRSPYVTSELVPLELARLLTPVFGLRGTLNLVALGVLMCVIASVAIASLATGLRIRPWAQILVAAAIWLIVADAAFFDLFASPFSEPAALVGLLLVAAGLVYLGRDRRASVRGLTLAGAGGFLVILAKEEYLFLAVPICLALVLAGPNRDDGPGLRRFRTPQARAAIGVAVVIAVAAAGYQVLNMNSSYAKRTEPMRAVDTIFEHIVNRHDSTKAADLRALGLPVNWSKYAGSFYWYRHSVRNDPLYPRYRSTLTDGHMAHYFLTHPDHIITVGEQAAREGLRVRVYTLGNYPPSAGHRPGALESRVLVVTWLAQRIPPRHALLWLVLLWLAMAAVALLALLRRRVPWHRDAAVVALCMTGCAVVGFIPPAYFDGISTARHMVVMNFALALAFAMSVLLAVSMISHRVARGVRGSRPGPAAQPDDPDSACLPKTADLP